MKIKISIAAWILLIWGFNMVPVHAQSAKSNTSYTVTGIITDAENGSALPGIHVDIAGVASAISEDNGSYSIQVPHKSALLHVSGYGYASRDIAVKGRNQINIELYDKGYKGVQKSTYTPTGDVSSTQVANSWSVIQENNILSVALSPDVLLQGYTTGINSAFRSGVPGAGVSMYMHGFNTMNAGSMPLFIVDGLPYENTQYAQSLLGNYVSNPLSSIDIKDIESITVMKDGTSLYGVKGANGVILIKTLRAEHMETKINAHVHTGINFTTETFPVLNGASHRSLLSELYQSQGFSSLEIQALPIFNSEIPVKQPWGYDGNVDYYRYNHETNWQKSIYDANFNQNFYLNVAGGDDIAKYVLSLGYLDQQGTIKNTNFQRFNTRFNSEVKLSNKVNFTSNMSFVYGNKDLVNEGPDNKLNPILASAIKSPFTTSHIFNEVGDKSPNEEPADYFGNSNPYVLLNNMMMANINYRFMGTFALNWDITKDINISGSVGLNFNKERERIFYPSVGIDFDPIRDNIVTNEMKHRTDRLFSLFTDFHGNYHKRLSSDHLIDARIGLRFQNNKAENDFGQAYNSSSDDFRTIGYGISLLRQIGGSIGNWRWFSLYGSADYNYLSKYFFNVSLSSDASSRYGRDAQTLYTYPSVAAAWLVSGEEFMMDADAIDLFKIRLSYGMSGNDDIGNYNGMQYYVPQNLFGNYGLIRGNLVNLNLKPETVHRLNAGFDFSLFKDRLNIQVDLYANTVNDMILITTPDKITGFNNYISNAGSMQNIGADLNVSTRILNGPVKWDLGVMVSTYSNKVLNLNGEEFLTEAAGAIVQTKVGQPLGVFYGHQAKGVYATQAEADTDNLHVLHGLVPVNFGAGDMRFVNQTTGDNLIDDNDRVVIGNPNPDLFGSITNHVKFKRWTLNALMVYSIGNDVYNYTRSQLENLSTYNNQALSTLNRWKYPGDITSIPKASFGDPMGNARFSDRWIEDGSYIKLKSVTVAYDFDFSWKLIQNITAFATAENLLTLTNYKGLDPEFAMGQNPLYYGIDPSVVPQPKTVSVGVKIEL